MTDTAPATPWPPEGTFTVNGARWATDQATRDLLKAAKEAGKIKVFAAIMHLGVLVGRIQFLGEE